MEIKIKVKILPIFITLFPVPLRRDDHLPPWGKDGKGVIRSLN
jgi:hypothetical protein